MSLLDKIRKKKTTPVIEYSAVEQGVPEKKVLSADEKLDQVLVNQGVIVANQQVILDTITKLPGVIMALAAEPMNEAVEPEKKKVKKQ